MYYMEKNKIRKLTIGDHQFGLSYQINQTFNKNTNHEITVSSIKLDHEYLLTFEIDKYDVYAKGVDGKEKLWKSFIRQKTMVEHEF